MKVAAKDCTHILKCDGVRNLLRFAVSTSLTPEAVQMTVEILLHMFSFSEDTTRAFCDEFRRFVTKVKLVMMLEDEALPEALP